MSRELSLRDGQKLVATVGGNIVSSVRKNGKVLTFFLSENDNTNPPSQWPIYKQYAEYVALSVTLSNLLFMKTLCEVKLPSLAGLRYFGCFDKKLNVLFS